ncbi:MAG: nucleotidyltransferase family protein [Flavobacteriales bacterium]|jgi:predicted nucleotidyltransferase
MSYLSQIQSTLKKMKPELTAKYSVNSIGLFGSVVRNDFNENSDIDVIVDFSKPIGIEFIDLANYLEKVFKRKIDLVSKKGIKERYFREIEGEIIYV